MEKRPRNHTNTRRTHANKTTTIKRQTANVLEESGVPLEKKQKKEVMLQGEEGRIHESKLAKKRVCSGYETRRNV